MKKRLFSAFAALLLPLVAFASDWGGVKATVVNRAGRIPIPEATVTVSRGAEVVASAKTGRVNSKSPDLKMELTACW